MKKKVKANLMIDEALIGRICDYAGLSGADFVLEIGAGTGNLTRRLLERGCRVIAIEKDASFVLRLKKEFGVNKDFTLLPGDALKTPFPECNKTVSNLPYDISKKVTERILSHGFELAVLVYQKEFIEKLVAKAGEENYRYISALTQSVSKVEVLEKIPPHAFSPAPRVSSAVVRLTPFAVADEGYMEFLRKLFNQRNKKISTILKRDDLGASGEKRAFQLGPGELKEAYSLAV